MHPERIKGTGTTDGEACERKWKEYAMFVAITREMLPGNRTDLLEDFTWFTWRRDQYEKLVDYLFKKREHVAEELHSLASEVEKQCLEEARMNMDVAQYKKDMSDMAYKKNQNVKKQKKEDQNSLKNIDFAIMQLQLSSRHFLIMITKKERGQGKGKLILGIKKHKSHYYRQLRLNNKKISRLLSQRKFITDVTNASCLLLQDVRNEEHKFWDSLPDHLLMLYNFKRQWGDEQCKIDLWNRYQRHREEFDLLNNEIKRTYTHLKQSMDILSNENLKLTNTDNRTMCFKIYLNREYYKQKLVLERIAHCMLKYKLN